MSDFEPDWQRLSRTGIAEAVLCDGKSVDQIDAIIASAAGRALLLTRLDATAFEALSKARNFDYDPVSRTAVSPGLAPPERTGIGIVCAGTSDLPVAREARRTLAFHGYDAPVIADVGVAGLWRLLQRLDDIRRLHVVIAVAGMEGALFSVLGGLIEAPVIAVPTSVGYGIGTGGRVALQSALASCAPGVVAVNIDNGYGAACAAIKMRRAGATG